MKKSVKRTLAAALALLMLISVFGVSALAERNERLPQYKNYTILGDSNSSGYGLDAYVENADGAFVKEGALIEGSYPAILADALGCENVFVHSHSGWRTNELLYMMDPDTEVSYSDFFLRALGFVPADTLIGKSEAIIANVSASDLITIEYGANDIYSYSVYKLIVEHGEELSYLLSGLGETPADISELLEDILAAADKAGVLAEVISDFMSYLTETTASYKENMVAIIERIRELNPNAKLVVLGLISPVSFDIRGENGSVILDINTGIDRRMKEVNDFLKNTCPVKDEYTFVDVSQAELFGIGSLDTGAETADAASTIFSAVKMVHPTAAGHAYIAQRIIDTLIAELSAPVVTADYSRILKRTALRWSGVEGAVSYRIYRSTSADGSYSYIGSSSNGLFFDLFCQKGTTYYYKVCAVMNYRDSVVSPMSMPVSITAK